MVGTTQIVVGAVSVDPEVAAVDVGASVGVLSASAPEESAGLQVCKQERGMRKGMCAFSRDAGFFFPM